MDDDLITLIELANMLKISRPTVDRWRREGLPFEKVGRGVRFEKEKALKWIQENKGVKK
jgi:excisionase family DNA binding protein